ncbi:MAG TPA: sulfatase-like hydrolase/transferase [Elusimicrobiota bacterium]|nr:sulfatase-like hydrolase/transferase [Elusimicrobiota bacterium]
MKARLSHLLESVRQLHHRLDRHAREQVENARRRRPIPIELKIGLWGGLALFILSYLHGPHFLPAPLLSEQIASQTSRAIDWKTVLTFQSTLLLLSMAIGLAIGWVLKNVCELGIRVFPRAVIVFKYDVGRTGVTLLGFLFIHSVLLLRTMRLYPAFYKDSFYFHSEALRSLQVYLTDIVPGWSARLAVAGVMILILLAGTNVVVKYLERFLRLSRPVRVGTLVLLSGLVLTLLGLWNVVRTQKTRNAGTNILLIVVDSMRSDAFERAERDPSYLPHLHELKKRGCYFDTCHVPVPESLPAITTLMTGKTPLMHGIRHPFPDQGETDLGPETLPALLRDQGYTSVAIADYMGYAFSRLAMGFDRIIAPRLDSASLLRTRLLHQQGHLFPYILLTGRLLFPEYRNMPELADPRFLAREADCQLRRLRFRDRFFLTLYFSATHSRSAVASDHIQRFANARYRGPFKYGGPAASRSSTLDDQVYTRAIYDANLQAVDAAVGKVLHSLKRLKLTDNTYIVFWSNHGFLYSDAVDQSPAVPSLLKRDIVTVPLFFLEPRLKLLPKTVHSPVRTEDIAPSLLDILNLPIPSTMEGRPLFRDSLPVRAQDPDSPGIDLTSADPLTLEPSTLYSETGILPDTLETYGALWMPDPHWWSGLPALALPAAGGITLPPIQELIEPDIRNGGFWTVRKDWEDLIIIAKKRIFQTGTERLIYVPEENGVDCALFDLSADPDMRKNLAPRQTERVKDIKEILFRFMARKTGWKPQNDYWIPEAFLKLYDR